MIDAFFKLLNFGIFIGILVYVWRKNLRAFFQNQLIKKRVKTEELAREEYAVLRAQESIQTQERDEHLLFASLRQKMAQWQSVQKQELDALNAQYARYEHDLKKRIALEIVETRNRHVKKTLLERVLQDSTKELKDAFENPKKNEAYIKEAVELLARDKDA